jgi:hypothetical protein
MAVAGSPFGGCRHAPNLPGGGSATTVYDEDDRPTVRNSQMFTNDGRGLTLHLFSFDRNSPIAPVVPWWARTVAAGSRFSGCRSKENVHGTEGALGEVQERKPRSLSQRFISAARRSNNPQCSYSLLRGSALRPHSRLLVAAARPWCEFAGCC